jgi:hypothetical protein
MNTGRSASAGSRFLLPMVALLAGVVLGMALPRPLQPVRAAQPPAATPQPPQAPLPFPGAPPPGTAGNVPADEAAATDDTAATDDSEAEGPPPVATRVFEAPAAMVMNFVQATGANGFEQMTRQLVQSMADSEDPERQGQAAGWTMYRVQEPGPNNNAVYVWLIDPVVTSANYAVPQLLNEAFPERVQQLYETYNQSFGIGQVVLNLDPVVLVQE